MSGPSYFADALTAWVRILCGTVCLLFATASSAAEPTLEQISGELQHWRSQISNIRFESHEVQMQILKNRFPDLDEATLRRDHKMVNHFQWTDTASFRCDNTIVEPGRKWTSRLGGDGTQRWSAIYVNDRMESLKIWTQLDERVILSTGARPLYGLWFGLQGIWLDEYLVKQSAKVLGTESFDGTDCIALELPFRENITKATLLLDPEASYLPRLIRTQNSDLAYQCDKFLTLPNGAPFPANGLENLIPEVHEYLTEWNVVDVHLNERLRKEDFAPPTPEAGATLTDNSRARIHGSRSQREELVARRVDEARQNVSGTPVTVEPLSIWQRCGWSIGILLVACMLLIAGTVLKWRA